MLLRYVGIVLRLSLLTNRMKLFPRFPLLGRIYRRKVRNRDVCKMLLLKSRLQEQVVTDIFGKNVAGIAFESYNGTLVNNVSDVAVSRSLGFAGAYDKEKILFLLSLLGKESCVYVIGAHIGTLVVPIASSVRKVVAFEANPSTFRFLFWNIQLSRLDNIEAYNYAIYNEETELTFYQNKANSGGSKIKPQKDHYWYNYDDPEVITVNGKVLDVFVAETGKDFPDMIIMDIEGAEYAALKGASACLRNARHLYIEFMPHHLSNVANITVKEFVEAITVYFPQMMLVNEVTNGQPITYKGEDILGKLTEYYKKGIGVDLLFLKQ